MADGFGAITFGILHEKPGGATTATYEVQHVPGGGNYLDIGGVQPAQYDVGLYLASLTDYESLRALVGTTATFTYCGTAHSGTLLASLNLTKRAPVFADATFITP